VGIVYWGDGGFIDVAHGGATGDGNWNTVANWYLVLSTPGGTCCPDIPGTPLGRTPLPGDSIVMAGFAAGTQDITTGPANWAGPLTWLGSAAPMPTFIQAGLYSGTVTVNRSGSIVAGYGIKGGSFTGTVALQGGTLSTPLAQISGGTFTGTVTRNNNSLPSTRASNIITGGTYSPTGTVHMAGGTITDPQNIPTDPGFAQGGGTFAPILTVLGPTAGYA
jgi:hypothetical protein